jgi:hypothetical protein
MAFRYFAVVIVWLALLGSTGLRVAALAPVGQDSGSQAAKDKKSEAKKKTAKKDKKEKKDTSDDKKMDAGKKDDNDKPGKEGGTPGVKPQQ